MILSCHSIDYDKFFLKKIMLIIGRNKILNKEKYTSVKKEKVIIIIKLKLF